MSVIYLSDPVAPLKALAIHTDGNTAAYLSHTCWKNIHCLHNNKAMNIEIQFLASDVP
jgi:hypothetical protein